MKVLSCLRLACGSLAFFTATSFAFAEPTFSERIDQGLRKKDPTYDKRAARLSDDAEFLRRVTLDLTGIIPSAEEARAFLGDKSADRRAKLVDRLLASEGYARHMMHTFDVLLMDRRPGTQVKLPEWQDYLRSAFAKNQPYDELVREILSNDGTDAKNRAPSRFFLDRKVEPHQLTKDISRVFLGMNLHCAQCHDHPLVDGYKQHFYYGIYAFLNRTYLFADKKSKIGVVAEKGDGDVTYESVFIAKVTNKTGPKLPGKKELVEPKIEKGKEYVGKVAKGERGIPTYSRRAKLAEEIVQHPQFARTTVNRVWAWLFGRGIVHPVEFDHEGNPPSHPELLDELAAAFRADKHDLKKLIRGMVLSQAYQRSSELPKDGSAVEPAAFLTAAVRPLSPEQYGWSLAQATGQLDAERKANPKLTQVAAMAKHAGSVQSVVALYATQPGEPAANQEFEVTLDQSLFLNNGKTLESWLAARPGSLVDRLVKTKDARAFADELYLSVLTRLPSDEERDLVAGQLDRPGVDRTRAIQEIAWALLTSVEFRFNH